MIRHFAPLALLGLVAACATGSSASAPDGERIGEPLENREVHQLSEIQAEPSKYFNQTLWVEAQVEAVCQSMGCWMQVKDGGETAMVRWEEGCGGQYQFPKDAVGERILIQGSFYPKEIAKEDREHLEEEAGQDVKIPEKGYEMNASAVVMLDRKAG